MCFPSLGIDSHPSLIGPSTWVKGKLNLRRRTVELRRLETARLKDQPDLKDLTIHDVKPVSDNELQDGSTLLYEKTFHLKLSDSEVYYTS